MNAIGVMSQAKVTRRVKAALPNNPLHRIATPYPAWQFGSPAGTAIGELNHSFDLAVCSYPPAWTPESRQLRAFLKTNRRTDWRDSFSGGIQKEGKSGHSHLTRMLFGRTVYSYGNTGNNKQSTRADPFIGG